MSHENEPIDKSDMIVPLQSGVDHDYVTQDMASRLYREVDALVERTMRTRGISRRMAALVVTEGLKSVVIDESVR